MKVFADKWPHNDDFLRNCITFYGEHFSYVDNIAEADVVFASDRMTSNIELNTHLLGDNQVLVVLYLGANHNYLTPSYFRTELSRLRTYHDKTIIVHTNLLDDSPDKGLVCFDVMLNRQKLFCTEYTDELLKYNWLWMNGCINPDQVYKLSSIKKKYAETNKHFLVSIRIVGEIHNTNTFENSKYLISKYVTEHLNNKSYVSDPLNGVYFKPNGWGEHTIPKFGGNWFPIGDEYYSTSYVSVVPEVLNRNHTQFGPCEKAFDAFTKGNFLLPFAAPNFIDNCKTLYGFEFVDWIDYSFDNIRDYATRLSAYLDSLKKLADLHISDLHNLYVRDREILRHNRNVFYTKPYDRLLPKLEQTLETLGWL